VVDHDAIRARVEDARRGASYGPTVEEWIRIVEELLDSNPGEVEDAEEALKESEEAKEELEDELDGVKENLEEAEEKFAKLEKKYDELKNKLKDLADEARS